MQLLKYGASWKTGAVDISPLMVASKLDRHLVVKTFLEHCSGMCRSLEDADKEMADLYSVDANGWTALHHAVSKNNVRSAKLLLQVWLH